MSPSPQFDPDEAEGEESWDSAIAAAFATQEPEGPDRQGPRGWSLGAAIKVPERNDLPPPPLVRESAEIDLRAGRLGRLEILGEIARGGVGVILEAHDPELGRRVAVKVLRDDHRDHPGLLRRFVMEAQIGAQLQHPGIVPVYELGLDQGERPYFTMKRVHGRSLTSLLHERSPDDLSRLLGMVEQVCQTVAYAHARGVVHRDLKPDNVMVGDFGEVLVMDWGFAKVLGTEAPEPALAEVVAVPSGSVAGTALGTPAYMAPEQARGQVIDARADVFALGAILLHLLAGRAPFQGDHPLHAARVADLGPAWLALAAAAVDPALATLTRQCLAVDPAARPAHAGEVAQALGAHRTSSLERARAAELAQQRAEERSLAERRARRRTLVLALAAIVSLVLGGGVFVHLRVRDAELATGIERTVAEAARLEREGKPREALDALQRALGLIAAGGRVEDRQLVAGEVARVTESLGSDRMLVRLRRLREDPSLEPRVVREYERLLRERGIGPEASVESLVAALRSGSAKVDVELARALEDLSRRRSEVGHGWLVPLEAAGRLDPDPGRERVRRAWAAEDRAALEQLAGQEPGDAATAVLLADALLGLRVPHVAVEVLERASRHGEDTFWAHYRLALLQHALGHDEPAARHAERAEALHPDAGWRALPEGKPPARPRRR